MINGAVRRSRRQSQQAAAVAAAALQVARRSPCPPAGAEATSRELLQAKCPITGCMAVCSRTQGCSAW